MGKLLLISLLFINVFFTGCSIDHKVDEGYITFCSKEGKIKIEYMNTVEIIKSVKSSYENDTLVLDVRVAIGKAGKSFYVGVDKDVSYIKVGKKIFNVQDIVDCPEVIGNRVIEDICIRFNFFISFLYFRTALCGCAIL